MGEEAYDDFINTWTADLYRQASKYHPHPRVAEPPSGPATYTWTSTTTSSTPAPPLKPTAATAKHSNIALLDMINALEPEYLTVEELETAIDALHDKIREKRGETW